MILLFFRVCFDLAASHYLKIKNFPCSPYRVAPEYIQTRNPHI